MTGSFSVVVELRDALNTIWHVHLDCGHQGLARVMRLLTKRFFSFTMMVGPGCCLDDRAITILLVNASSLRGRCSRDEFQVLIGLADEYPAKARREYHAASAELFNVRSGFRITTFGDKLHLARLAVVKDAIARSDLLPCGVRE